MGKKAFSSAIFRKDEHVETISVNDVNKELYENKYKGYLFCPNEKCGARLKFVQRKNGAVSMFQSINIKEHIRDCPNRFEYVKYDSDSKVRKHFSEDHIMDSLKRQLSKFGVHNVSTYKKKVPVPSKTKNRRDEPPIQFFNCENVYENLVGHAISVGGFVHSVKINDEDNPDKIHAYINFQMPDDRRVNVRISNTRYRQEPETKDIVALIKKEWENTPYGMHLLCICFGWVKKAANGIDIAPAYPTSIRTSYIKA